MNIAPLKNLIRAQNFTLVFRNYWRFKKCGRTLICIFMCFEVLITLVLFVYHIQFDDIMLLAAQILYTFCLTLFSFALSILPVYHSKKFEQLLSNFDAFYSLFGDEIYTHILLQAQKNIIKFVIFFCTLKFVIITYLKATNFVDAMNIRIEIMNDFNLSTCEFRFTIEYFILHAILFTVSEQLNVIARSINYELLIKKDERRKRNLEEIEMGKTPEDLLKKFDLWMAAYKNITSSCNLCNIMYSTQLAMMLSTIIIYCIILLYTMVTTIANDESPAILLANIVTMIYFVIALYIISRAGQRVYNNSTKLRCKLGELYIHSIESEIHLKLSKDLLRYCLTHPVHIHLMGSLNINMSLLPSCMTIATSNSIIALQFNNVL